MNTLNKKQKRNTLKITSVHLILFAFIFMILFGAVMKSISQ